MNDIMEDVVDEERGIQMAIEMLESSGVQSLDGVFESIESGFRDLSEQTETSFGELSEQLLEITSGIGDVASILEWGFEGIEWKLDRVRGTLGNIEKILKTPSQTQANEQREIAEKLRGRGVLSESVKFFLRSLDRNPLDYRTYIGLGKTYLKMGELYKARVCWRKSLPHAPKGRINYKSYSYRLIGRAYYYEGSIPDAILALSTSIGLSRNYYWGYYDLAQYYTLNRNKKDGFFFLATAVSQKPSLLELAKKERDFYSLMNWWAIREEIEFRNTWYNFGISHQCIDKMIYGLKNLINEQGGAYPLQVREILTRILKSKGVEVLPSTFSYNFSSKSITEWDETVRRIDLNNKLWSILRDVEDLQLWPQVTVPINPHR